MAGLAATVLLAAGAFGAGALPDADPATPSVRPAEPLADSWVYWLGLLASLAGLVVLAVAWWRLGRAIRHDPGRISLRWLLVTGAVWAAPLLLAPPLASRDVYAYACQGAVWLDGFDPYRVGVAVGGCPWVETVPPLWRDTTTPYGPLAVALAGAVVAVARAVTDSGDGQLLVSISLFRVIALVGGLLIAAYAPRLARACGVDPVAALCLGLVSPLVAVHAVSGAHNDALMVGLVLAALALAMRSRTGLSNAMSGPVGLMSGPVEPISGPVGLMSGPVGLMAAGAALGLATAIKVTALVAAPFVVLLAVVRIPVVREQSSRHADNSPDVLPDHRDLGRVVAGGVLAFGGLSVAFGGLSLVTGLDLGWIRALRDTGNLVQWTSVPSGVGMAVGYLLRLAGWPETFDTAVTAARALGFGTLVATMAVLVVRAWRSTGDPPTLARRRVLAACGAAFVALALLSPVFYPWYGLTALAVLAVAVADVRWQRRLAGAVLVLSFLVLPNGLGLATLTKVPGALLDVVLVVAVVVLLVRRARRRPTGT